MFVPEGPRYTAFDSFACPFYLQDNMASRASSRFLANDPLPVHIGDKVARFFHSHELKAGLSDQWIIGKVTATRLSLKKGTKNQQQPWWTLSFEAPCSRLLCFNREEVEEMKEQYNILRLKTVALQTQVGRQLTVQWTDEDSDLSMTTWAGDVRICEVTRYLAAQKKYVLRFKCGYEKIVDALPLIQMVESSAEVMASKKVKTKKGWFKLPKNGNKISQQSVQYRMQTSGAPQFQRWL